MKLIQTILILLVILTMTFCDQETNTLRKAPLSIEIVMKNKTKVRNSSFQPEAFFLNTPPTRYFNDILYFRSNRDNGFILQINTITGKGLMIGSNKNGPEINFVRQIIPIGKNEEIKTQKQTVETRLKSYHFNYIADFCPSQLGDIYVLNVEIPKNEPRAKAPVRPRAYRRGVKAKPVKPLNRYILKFDSRGKLLYKLGKTGKNGQSFDGEKTIFKMACDEENNFYLILRSQSNYSNKGKIVTPKRYELFRFNENGELDYHYPDIMKYIPFEKNYDINIDEIEISPDGKQLLVLTSYYNKILKSSKQGVHPDKKMLFYLINNNKSMIYKHVRTLGKKDKYYSIFTVSNKNKIILNVPEVDRKENLNFTVYHFQVLNELGKNEEIKKLYIDRHPGDKWHWLTKANVDGFMVFTEKENGYFCQVYY